MNGTEFEKLLGKHNMRQKDLQAMLGVSRSTCYRKCNGKTSFTPAQLTLLIHCFGEEDINAVFGLGGGGE